MGLPVRDPNIVLCEQQRRSQACVSAQSGQHHYYSVSERYNPFEPRHKTSNNGVCTTSKASDQPAYTRSLIRALPSRSNILSIMLFGVSKLKGCCTGSSESTLVKMPHCWNSNVAANFHLQKSKDASQSL